MNDYEKAILIWFDESIRRPEYCPVLKAAFAKAVYQEWNCPTILDDITIETYVRDAFSQNLYCYETIAINLYTFSDMEECLQCIGEQQHRKIFLIVSSISGKRIVPQIDKRYPDFLQKFCHYQLPSLYILPSHTSAVEDIWCAKYAQYSQCSLGETDLLKKLMNDVARYFITLGRRQHEFRTNISISQALEYYKWAKILLERVFGENAEWVCKQTLQDVKFYTDISEAELRNRFSHGIDQLTYGDNYKGYADKSFEANMFNNMVEPVFTVVTDNEDGSGIEECLESNTLLDREEELMVKTKQCMIDETHRAVVKVHLRKPRSPDDNFKNLQSLLTVWFTPDLVISLDAAEYFKRIEVNDSSVFIQTLSGDDDKQALEKICSKNTAISLYVLGIEPSTINDRKHFFTTYPQVRAIMSDPKELATKVTLDVILKNRVLGARYATKGDKKAASIVYDQCVELLKQLNALVQ